jgi:hypothetical protein
MVGFVRWSRNCPRIKENLSGGVGLVCGMKCGMKCGIFNSVKTFSVRVHVGPPRPTISCALRPISPRKTLNGGSGIFHLQVIREDHDRGDLVV